MKVADRLPYYQYGLHDIFIGVPCRLGCHGIESVLEQLSLTDAELAALHASPESVRQNINRATEMLAAADSTS